MDIWQQVDAQITEAKAEYEKYLAENPKLKAENLKLRDEKLEYKRLIANAEAKLQEIKIETDTRITQAEQKCENADKYCDKIIEEANISIDKQREHASKRLKMVETKEKELEKRESNIIEDEKLNVAKCVEIDESTKQLQEQADEIKLATKTLTNKSIDVNKDAEVNSLRNAELDVREANILKAEQDIEERQKRSVAAQKQAQENFAKSEQLLSTNDLRKVELDKKEQFMKNKDEDLKKRELELKKRTDNFVDSLRMGKVV